MADHTPANLEHFSGVEPTIHPERHVIVACPNFKGQERTPEYVLYMQRASSRAKGCFPIQLTRSKNLVYHTLQLFAEEVVVREKTDPKYRYIPSYGDKSPYKVVVTTVTKDNTYELSVLAKGKKKDALLKGTIEEGRLKIDSESDKHEIYLPQKGREIKKDKTPTPIQNDWQWDVFI